MYQGNLVEYGSSKQIFNTPQHSYTKKLISSNLSLNLDNNTDNNVILKAENITVTFPLQKNLFGKVTKELKAVNDVSFELNRGETLGIVGESGSGKTTLAMAIVNLVKYSGKISIKNNDIMQEVKDFSKNLQVVFQDPYNSLNPRMNIAQIIGEGLSVHYPQINADERMNMIKEIVQEVELSEDILQKYPHEFSGGQRQRIALARTLILNPQVIILDEPTSALDVTVQAQVVKLLKKLQQKHKLSYIFISHDMNAVRAMSHKIMVMKDGKIVESGSVNDIFNSPQQAYTKQLIKASII
jgi:microcin C transport system ATP-binding protein